MSLNQYHKKRDFSKTPEPKGKIAKNHARLFIIQKHAASHLHYDFRIELGGILKSWAVPKGPSLDPSVKRLAMHVEDHPLEYGSFEGIIPKGQYGGGTVMLWDRGSWEPLDKDPRLAYEKGHLRFNLHAEKLNGRWDLIRFKDERHWFLIKYKDAFARSQEDEDITLSLPKSVVSDYTLEEIAANYNSIWTGSGAKKVKANVKKIKDIKKEKVKKPTIVLPESLNKVSFPSFISPQLATLVDKPPEGEQWLHEIKFDGYRILVFKDGSKITLKSRNNKDWTSSFPALVNSIRQLPFKQIVMDGEVVVLDDKGRSDFQLLQNALNEETQKDFFYYLFDLIYFEGFDLKKLPLIERKAILKNLLSIKIPFLYYSDHIIKEGHELYHHSCAFALEGIVSKKLDGVYIPKRSKEWLKIKCLTRQEFVVGGYTNPKGKRGYFGSLLLGVYNGQGILNYTGKVGTGFNETISKEINDLFSQNKSNSNPFNIKPPGFSTAHWLKPKLVCEVEFTEWTQDGHLRHPSFKGMRLDKAAKEVIHELKQETEKVIKKNGGVKGNSNLKKNILKSKITTTKKKPTQFAISNPDKILYPEDKVTKHDLLNYYELVSPLMLPFISLRPLTLLRCPTHYKECFFQRHYNEGTPQALHPLLAEKTSNPEQYIYLNSEQGLFNLVQMGVLEIHPWGSKIQQLEYPDVIVFDLDPGPGVSWSEIVSAAKEIRDYLLQYKLISFVKSTGGKGLHVVLPIKPEYEWSEVKEFSHVFVSLLERIHPDRFVSKMTKSKREGKIFLDYLRNQRTATAIAPYSTRARLHVPVAIPLFWDELSNRIQDNVFTIKTLPKRLKELKEDPWKEFWKIKQSLRLEQF